MHGFIPAPSCRLFRGDNDVCETAHYIPSVQGWEPEIKVLSPMSGAYFTYRDIEGVEKRSRKAGKSSHEFKATGTPQISFV